MEIKIKSIGLAIQFEKEHFAFSRQELTEILYDMNYEPTNHDYRDLKVKIGKGWHLISMSSGSEQYERGAFFKISFPWGKINEKSIPEFNTFTAALVQELSKHHLVSKKIDWVVNFKVSSNYTRKEFYLSTETCGNNFNIDDGLKQFEAKFHEAIAESIKF